MFYLPILRTSFIVSSLLILTVSSVLADESHKKHGAFKLQADQYTHGMEVGNVKTEDNIIELYGRLFLSANYNYVPEVTSTGGVIVDDHSEENRFAFLSSSGSRFGVRGHKNISLTARLFWQIESSVDLNNLGEYDEQTHYGNTAEFAGRDSFIGLGTAYGSFIFGKHNSPYKMSVHSWDPFNHVNGDFRSLLGRVNGFSTKYDHHSNLYHTRIPNTLLYYSPEWKGLSTNIAIGDIMESAETQTPLFSANIKYNIGPFDFTYAFEQHWYIDQYQVDHDSTPVEIDGSASHLAGVMLHLGNTMISAVGERLIFSDSNRFNRWVRYAWHAAITHKIGKHSLRLSYTQSGQFLGEPDGGLLLAAGWFYNISEKTLIHLTATHTRNQQEANYGNFMSDNFEHDEDITSVALGLIHAF